MRHSLPPLRYLKDNVQLRRGALGQRLVHTLIVGGGDRGEREDTKVRLEEKEVRGKGQRWREETELWGKRQMLGKR